MSVLYVRDPDTGKLTPIPTLRGENGKSAYEIAVEKGFKGSEDEWLASLKGEKGADGYDYVLTEEDKAEITENVIAEFGDVVRKPQGTIGSDGVVLVVDDTGAEDWRYLAGETEPPEQACIPVYALDGTLRVSAPIEDGDAVNKGYLDERLGGIESAFDELHTYAQALVNGGAAE